MAGEVKSGSTQGATQLDALQGIINLFTGGKGATRTTTTNVNQNAVNAALQNIVQSNQGLASITAGQHAAGLYNSTVNTQMTNDFLTRAASEAAQGTKTTTETTKQSGGINPALLGAFVVGKSVLGPTIGKMADKYGLSADALGKHVSDYIDNALGLGSSGSDFAGSIAPNVGTDLATDYGGAFAGSDFSNFAGDALGGATDFITGGGLGDIVGNVSSIGSDIGSSIAGAFGFADGGRVPSDEETARQGLAQRAAAILANRKTDIDAAIDAASEGEQAQQSNTAQRQREADIKTKGAPDNRSAIRKILGFADGGTVPNSRNFDLSIYGDDASNAVSSITNQLSAGRDYQIAQRAERGAPTSKVQGEQATPNPASKSDYDVGKSITEAAQAMGISPDTLGAIGAAVQGKFAAVPFSIANPILGILANTVLTNEAKANARGALNAYGLGQVSTESHGHFGSDEGDTAAEALGVSPGIGAAVGAEAGVSGGEGGEGGSSGYGYGAAAAESGGGSEGGGSSGPGGEGSSGFANGGRIAGNNTTGIDDKIARTTDGRVVRLSGGERIIPTDVANMLGDGFFDMLNNMMHTPAGGR